MNTLRENDGYPPQYPTVQDSEVPVLVSNDGRLMVTNKPSNFGTLNVMCADKFVKLPYNEASEVRLTNNTPYETAVAQTWSKNILGDFDKPPYEDGKSIDGVNGWEGQGVTTPDDRNDDLRTPVLDILQGRRSVLVEGKITKAAPTTVPNGSKVASLFRPRVNSRSVGLGIYDSGKSLKLGVYTKDKVFGLSIDGVDTDTAIEVTSNEIRLEILIAPTTGAYKVYAYQGSGRQEIGSGTTSAIRNDTLSYDSWRVGAEANGSIVDQFSYYMLNETTIKYELLSANGSATYPVIDGSDEMMIKNLGSPAGNFEDKADPIFISGFFAKS
jgi:hypothetical protein